MDNTILKLIESPIAPAGKAIIDSTNKKIPNKIAILDLSKLSNACRNIKIPEKETKNINKK